MLLPREYRRAEKILGSVTSNSVQSIIQLEYIKIGRVHNGERNSPEQMADIYGNISRSSAHHAYAWVWGFHKTYHAAISSTRKERGSLVYFWNGTHWRAGGRRALPLQGDRSCTSKMMAQKRREAPSIDKKYTKI
ncbi:hypothetical protein B0H14DRAFT_2576646 [Mycena olivaceomarginata]|nr:hypothetical protein B0H14DRAFT_2576646 [Mycena olivaceomarginata]